MSLLNLRKKKTESKTTPKKEVVVKGVAVANGQAPVSSVRLTALIRPHITEKASSSAERGVYVFEVAMGAGKRDIALAVQDRYKVTPRKVTIVAIPKRNISVKGRPGVRKARKKAYVHLEKGEKIEVI